MFVWRESPLPQAQIQQLASAAFMEEVYNLILAEGGTVSKLTMKNIITLFFNIYFLFITAKTDAERGNNWTLFYSIIFLVHGIFTELCQIVLLFADSLIYSTTPSISPVVIDAMYSGFVSTNMNHLALVQKHCHLC